MWEQLLFCRHGRALHLLTNRGKEIWAAPGAFGRRPGTSVLVPPLGSDYHVRAPLTSSQGKLTVHTSFGAHAVCVPPAKGLKIL